LHLARIFIAFIIIVVVIAGLYYSAKTQKETGSSQTPTKSKGYKTSTETMTQSLTSATTTSTLATVNLKEIKPDKILISMNVIENKLIIEYKEIDKYSEKNYDAIKNHWNDFLKTRTAEIKDVYAHVNTEIENITVTRDDKNNTVLIKFDVGNEIWTSFNRTTADFLWFLRAWNLDFIQDHFTEKNNGLFWNGTINGVEVHISILLPPQPEPYKAWNEPYGHCHGHVWWPKH
jgi:hypothetical protein